MKKYILLPILFMVFAINAFCIDGVILKTKDYNFVEKWIKIKSDDGPVFANSDTIFKNQIFYLVIPFKDYALGAKDMVDVSLSVKISKPNGSEYIFEDIPEYYKSENNPKNFVLIGSSALKISFEDKDEFGKYNINVKITDNISGDSKELQSTIDLIELPKYSDFVVKNDNELGKWFSFYYTKIDPEKALANFIYFSKSDISKNGIPPFHVMEFFVEIFKNNTFLYPQILEAFKNEKGEEKKMLLFLISLLDMDENLFMNELTKEEKENYAEMKNFPIPALYEKIEHPIQLDMLWGNFMASGSYKPILKLIQTLDYVKYNGKLEEYKSKKNKTKEDENEALYNAIYTSLVWSLRSNLEQHTLVKQYLQWAYDHENLNDVQKKELGKILEVE